MATPREHIEEIRTRKFSIGGEDNPLTEDLHHAVKHLSTELYSKDIHFLMELIQNAEDNDYPPNVEPSLEFVITSRDLTGVGAPATLLVFNNETGFAKANIESLCSVGRSTKKGRKQEGYIGEKGIGFKSVFLIAKQPYIFSNGYKIRFNEIPPPGTKIGYIVPEWIEERPNREELQEVYGHRAELPNTIIVLPLRPEKVDAVKAQLANIHPEIILFMSKIKKLSVREYNEDTSLNRVNAISVSRETEFRTMKSKDSECFILHLSAQENEDRNSECSYYMWRQCFPVQEQSRIEERKGINKWVITLAFPMAQRLNRIGNALAAGIYAFLPTDMVTGFPFIIQADFLLVSSRESIILNNKWNLGILNCIPSAFCSAFISLLHCDESAPPISSSNFFKYLPVNTPSCWELRLVRDSIQSQLKEEEIIFSETHNAYCMPKKARRILPAFREILDNATKSGVESPTSAMCSTGVFIVHSCMEKFSRALEFLGVGYLTYQWYSNCIQSTSGWVANLSEDLYVRLLHFLAEHWEKGISSSIKNVPLFKFVNGRNRVGWASLSDISNGCRLYFSSEVEHISWLANWSGEFGGVGNLKFLPDATQTTMRNLDSQWPKLREWLNYYPQITELSVSSFSKQLLEQAKVSRSSKFVITVTQFLYLSYASYYINCRDFQRLCSDLPVVNDSGYIVKSSRAKLVPASISKWAKLLGSNPWAQCDLVALSSAYLKPPPCAGGLKGEDDLDSFIKTALGAVDIPHLSPPDIALPGFSSPLDQEKTFLLLEWIQYLTVNHTETLPEVFMRSIAQGKWLRTYRGCQSPSMSFLFNCEWQSAGFQLNDLPFIDTSFYSKPMDDFKRALQLMGVVVEFGKGCDIIAKHLQMHMELQAITRLYKYLHRFKWKPRDSNSVKIWIPLDGGVGGKWKDSKLCVVHDDDGLFHSRLHILGRLYEAELLPFFSSYLGVSLHPRIEDYCSLWLDWVSGNHDVSAAECCSVWRIILKHWAHSSEKIKRCLGRECLRLPAYTSTGDIQLSAPDETFIPDDLQLKELFMRASTRPTFAWHPNPSDPEIPLDSLFSTYIHLGARNISQATQKVEISVPNNISLRKIPTGGGMVRIGLYRIVLAYLAHPSFKLSPNKRHQIVSTLVESTAYEATKPFTVTYSLSLPTENGLALKVEARKTSLVRWERQKQRILIQSSDPHNPKANMSLATDFAEAISAGLLLEHPDLVAGLCEMVKLGCILRFDNEVVNLMLQSKNFQLFVEDENFLLSIFPEVFESFFPSEPPRTSSTDNLGDRKSIRWTDKAMQSTAGHISPVCLNRSKSGGRKSIGPPAEAIRSTIKISPDCLKGWEKRLLTFKQVIDNMKKFEPKSMKMKLVTLLFPSTLSDGNNLCSFLKLIGDAQLKMLIALEVLGCNKNSWVMPLKLEDVLYNSDWKNHKKILELGKYFGGSRKAEQSSSSSSTGEDEFEFEMLKALIGTVVLSFYGTEGNTHQTSLAN